MRTLALVVVMTCGSSKPTAPPAAGPLINRMTDFVERCDACKAERDCLQPLRDEWEAAKQPLLADGRRIVGDDKATFDALVLHLRLCGDGGGVTFWVDQ